MTAFEEAIAKYRAHVAQCAACRAASDPGVPLDREPCEEGRFLMFEVQRARVHLNTR